MSQKSDEPRAFDPFAPWQTMRDAGMDAWVKMMTQMVNSEEYARAMSSMLDAYLATSAPLRKLIEAMMAQFVSSEAYTKANRELFDTYLTTSAPFREAMQTAFAQALTQFNPALAATAGSATNPFDPTGVWKTMRDNTLDAWSGVLTPASFQQMIETAMAQTLTQFNMPTRNDVTSLSERLDSIETRLNAIESKLGTDS